MFPDDGRDLDTLAQYADAAMYRAKLDGRNAYRFYSSDMHTQAARTCCLKARCAAR